MSKGMLGGAVCGGCFWWESAAISYVRMVNGKRGGKREHEGRWVGKIIAESKSGLGRAVFVGSKDPLLLL